MPLDPKVWDCEHCQSYQLDKKRNCYGQHPNSVTAQKGFYLGPMKVYQCPKTMLTRRDREMVELPDIQQKLGLQLNPQKLSNRYVQLVKLIEAERALIIQQERADKEAKAKAQQKRVGGNANVNRTV